MKKVLVLAVTAMFAIAVSAQNTTAPATKATPTQTAPATQAAPAKSTSATAPAKSEAKMESKGDNKMAPAKKGTGKKAAKKSDNAATPATPAQPAKK